MNLVRRGVVGLSSAHPKFNLAWPTSARVTSPV